MAGPGEVRRTMMIRTGKIGRNPIAHKRANTRSEDRFPEMFMLTQSFGGWLAGQKSSHEKTCYKSNDFFRRSARQELRQNHCILIDGVELDFRDCTTPRTHRSDNARIPNKSLHRNSQ